MELPDLGVYQSELFDEQITTTPPSVIIYRNSEQNEDLDAKISAFDYSNPLGITLVQQWFLKCYAPVLVGITVCLNLFGLYVLKSRYLRGLVCQPILTSLLTLHLTLILSGPLYIYLVQCFGIYLSQSKVYLCFLLTWVHNFSMIGSSWTVVLLVVERALTIGRSEVIWTLWQHATRSVLNLLFATAFLMAVLGLLHVDSTVADTRQMYPVCVPWWQNEHRSIGPLWFKVLAFLFSICPSILILVSLLMLLISLARFRLLLRWSVEALNRYNSLLVELKATMHFKFVQTALWFGPLFVLMVAPLGMFIVMGPTLFIRLHKNSNMSQILFFTNNLPQENTTSSLDSQLEDTTLTSNGLGQTPFVINRGQPFEHVSAMEMSYLLLSRTDVETSIWMLYYSFALMVVPMMLATEILFRREWRGRLLQIKRMLLCQGSEGDTVPDFSVLWEEDMAHPECHVSKFLSPTGEFQTVADLPELSTQPKDQQNHHHQQQQHPEVSSPVDNTVTNMIIQPKIDENTKHLTSYQQVLQGKKSPITSGMMPTPLAQLNLSPRVKEDADTAAPNEIQNYK